MAFRIKASESRLPGSLYEEDQLQMFYFQNMYMNSWLEVSVWSWIVLIKVWFVETSEPSACMIFDNWGWLPNLVIQTLALCQIRRIIAPFGVITAYFEYVYNGLVVSRDFIRHTDLRLSLFWGSATSCWFKSRCLSIGISDNIPPPVLYTGTKVCLCRNLTWQSFFKVRRCSCKAHVSVPYCHGHEASVRGFVITLETLRKNRQLRIFWIRIWLSELFQCLRREHEAWDDIRRAASVQSMSSQNNNQRGTAMRCFIVVPHHTNFSIPIEETFYVFTDTHALGWSSVPRTVRAAHAWIRCSFWSWALNCRLSRTSTQSVNTDLSPIHKSAQHLLYARMGITTQAPPCFRISRGPIVTAAGDGMCRRINWHEWWPTPPPPTTTTTTTMISLNYRAMEKRSSASLYSEHIERNLEAWIKIPCGVTVSAWWYQWNDERYLLYHAVHIYQTSRNEVLESRWAVN